MQDLVIGILSILVAVVYFAVGHPWHKYVCGCE